MVWVGQLRVGDMALPNYQGGDQPFQLMQSTWSAQIDPVLALPIVKGLQLDGITISSGSAAIINHRLGRNQQGFFVTDVNSSALIWRTQPFNSKTLTLASNALVTINLWVY